MATTFSIETTFEGANGESETITTNYKSTFQSGVFRVSVHDVESNTYIMTCEQPWHPTSDGQRSAWASEAEAVEWFKSEQGS